MHPSNSLLGPISPNFSSCRTNVDTGTRQYLTQNSASVLSPPDTCHRIVSRARFTRHPVSSNDGGRRRVV